MLNTAIKSHKNQNCYNLLKKCLKQREIKVWSSMLSGYKSQKYTGCPKKMSIKPIFEFQTLGGVFLGVKNNSKNFGNKKIVGSLAKFWIKQGPFTQNFAKQPNIFFVPKVLRIIFYP